MMKLTLQQVVSGITLSFGISLLVAGCVISVVPMIVVGITLFLAGSLLAFLV